MFYSHGGGFVTGSGGSRGQDGANLARNFDVVAVETNQRLGLLGFLWLDELLYFRFSKAKFTRCLLPARETPPRRAVRPTIAEVFGGKGRWVVRDTKLVEAFDCRAPQVRDLSFAHGSNNVGALKRQGETS
jgi:hypothetical protein